MRAAGAVRRRAPPDHAAVLPRNDLSELERDSRLPDARRAEHGDEVTPALVDDALPGARQNSELTVTADEGDSRDWPLADPRDRANGEPGLDGRVLALREDRLRGPELDRAAGPYVRLLADEHSADRRGGLQPGRGVDDVPGDKGLAMFGARIEGHQRLARVHRDAELQPFVLGPVPDGERGPHRALGVVAVGDRRAEDAHDGIADELLDAPAVALELSPNALVVGNEERPHVLRVELLGAGGEPDEIDEQHGDDSPFLPGRGGSGEGCAAGVAELRPVRVLLSAAWAGEHER